MQHAYVADFNILLEAAVNQCVDLCRKYNTERALSGIPETDKSDLKNRFTHLKDDEFFKKRKELYRHMFKSVFMRDSEWIKPVPEGKQKERMSFAGPFSSGRHILFNLLLSKKLKAEKLDVKFDEVLKHAVIIDFDEMRLSLQEYVRAVEAGYPHASSIVRGEVSAMSLAMIDLAAKCGYNIIEKTGSYSVPINDQTIEEMSKNGTYKLSFVGVISDPQQILTWAEKRSSVTGRNIPQAQIIESIRGFAHPDAFMKLMRQSSESYLFWNHGNAKFSVVAHAQDGKLTIDDHGKKMKFDQQRSFSVEPYYRSF